MRTKFNGQSRGPCVPAARQSSARAAMLLLAVGAALGLAAPAAHATLLVDESWNYTNVANGATMNGVTANAVGLSGTYTTQPGDTPTFTYNDTGIAFGNLQQSGQGSVSFSNVGLQEYKTQYISAPISASTASSTLYGSYVVQGTVVNSGVSGSGNDMEMQVDIGSQYQGQGAPIDPLFEAYAATFGALQLGQFTAGHSNNATLTAGTGVTSYTTNTPYLVLFTVTGLGTTTVGGAEWVLTAAQYNNFASTNTLDPTDLTNAARGSSATDVTAAATMSPRSSVVVPTLTGQYLNIGGYSAGTYGTTTFGEVRLSDTSLAEAAPVAAVPEPAVLGLMAAAGMGLLLLRRRRAV